MTDLLVQVYFQVGKLYSIKSETIHYAKLSLTPTGHIHTKLILVICITHYLLLP